MGVVAHEDVIPELAERLRPNLEVRPDGVMRFRAVRKEEIVFPAETEMIPLGSGGHTAAYQVARVAYHVVRKVGD